MKKVIRYVGSSLDYRLDGEDDYEHMVFGSTKFCCNRCGLYHDLSPRR